jgi:hypothetical protein
MQQGEKVMTRKCDFCGLDIQCNNCDVLGASTDDHWHTCDLSCAHELRALVRKDETQKEYRQRSETDVRPVPSKAEQFEYQLCGDCLAIWNESNSISWDEMCPLCRTNTETLNPEWAAFLKQIKVSLE